MKRGFSLVELSIVLVILGLLTGGILAGQSLIRAAELRSLTTQAQNYTTAYYTFRDKYFGIAGDFANATKFWGAVGGGTAQCAAPSTDTDTGLPTCNGDGDGRISNLLALNESFRFWEHLAAAGLIEGTYTGITTTVASAANTPGVNSPKTRIGSGGWEARERGASGDANFFSMTYGNTLQVGSPSNGGSTYLPLIKPEEAWNIDTKMDDGLPAQGKMIAVQWNICTNAATNTQTDALYELSSTDIACAFLFRNL